MSKTKNPAKKESTLRRFIEVRVLEIDTAYQLSDQNRRQLAIARAAEGAPLFSFEFKEGGGQVELKKSGTNAMKVLFELIDDLHADVIEEEKESKAKSEKEKAEYEKIIKQAKADDVHPKKKRAPRKAKLATAETPAQK